MEPTDVRVADRPASTPAWRLAGVALAGFVAAATLVPDAAQAQIVVGGKSFETGMDREVLAEFEEMADAGEPMEIEEGLPRLVRGAHIAYEGDERVEAYVLATFMTPEGEILAVESTEAVEMEPGRFSAHRVLDGRRLIEAAREYYPDSFFYPDSVFFPGENWYPDSVFSPERLEGTVWVRKDSGDAHEVFEAAARTGGGVVMITALPAGEAGEIGVRPVYFALGAEPR